MSKLQKDCRDMSTREKEAQREAARQKDIAEVAVRDAGAIRAQMAEVVDERVKVKMLVEEHKDRADMLATENAGLRDKFRAVEEEARGKLKEAERLAGVEEELFRAREEVSKRVKEVRWVEQTVKTKEGEVEELKMTI